MPDTAARDRTVKTAATANKVRMANRDKTEVPVTTAAHREPAATAAPAVTAALEAREVQEEEAATAARAERL